MSTQEKNIDAAIKAMQDAMQALRSFGLIDDTEEEDEE